MARFLTTIPVNIGFVNLGKVQAYPTGGTGPTAYGPTTYFGSDPKPAIGGDSINTPLNLGDFSELFREVPIKGTHGGLSRKVSSFYKFVLHKKRSVQITQNYSEFAYTKKTNRNTLISFYKKDNYGTFRQELAVNDSGYVIDPASVNENTEELKVNDYPTQQLDTGTYFICVTNDFRYLETEFSISLNVFNTDWGEVAKGVSESMNFGDITGNVDSELNFGEL
tara:strand:+ start:1136 stop:1804 length:669 start_codon:yes stop_codon:yes gene_type:complete